MGDTVTNLQKSSTGPKIVLFFFLFPTSNGLIDPEIGRRYFLNYTPCSSILIIYCQLGGGGLETSMATPLGNRIGCNSFLLLVRVFFLILINHNVLTNDYV